MDKNGNSENDLDNDEEIILEKLVQTKQPDSIEGSPLGTKNQDMLRWKRQKKKMHVKETLNESKESFDIQHLHYSQDHFDN